MVKVFVVGINGDPLLDVTLEPDDYVQAIRGKVWMKLKDPSFQLATADGKMLSDGASIAESGIEDGAQITVVKKDSGGQGPIIPPELQGFWDFLVEKKVSQPTLDMWFLQDLSKMSKETQATFMDQFASCETIDACGPTRSLPHKWEFSGESATGDEVAFEWECE